jgi:hypothetical protein
MERGLSPLLQCYSRVRPVVPGTNDDRSSHTRANTGRQSHAGATNYAVRASGSLSRRTSFLSLLVGSSTLLPCNLIMRPHGPTPAPSGRPGTLAALISGAALGVRTTLPTGIENALPTPGSCLAPHHVVKGVKIEAKYQNPTAPTRFSRFSGRIERVKTLYCWSSGPCAYPWWIAQSFRIWAL